jgi:hypothetical protein
MNRWGAAGILRTGSALMALVVVLGLLAAIVAGYFATRPARWSASQEAAPAQLAPTRSTTPARPVAAQPVPACLQELDLRLPHLDGIAGVVVVASQSDDRRQYRTNVSNLSCSCPDFVKRRAHLPDRDLRRICKHLVEALERVGALDRMDDVARAIVSPRTPRGSKKEQADGVREERFFQLNDGEDVVVFGLSTGGSWISVFARRGGSRRANHYRRYAFSVRERRWASGAAPFGSPALERVVDELFLAAA